MSRNFTLLDGGLGRELERIGAPFRQPEWSALALMEAPEKVRQAHESFIQAGADIVTVNSYALVPYHIGQDTYDLRAQELIQQAVDLAHEAAASSPRKLRIAASLPPIFGSYRPNAFDVGSAISVANTLIEEQDDRTDFWLMETMGLIAEAQLYMTLLREKSKAIWVSFSLDDHAKEPCLRSGEPLAEAIDAVAGEADAILLNCSTVEAIDHAVPILADNCTNIPYGIYANAFAALSDDVLSNVSLNPLRNDITPEKHADYAVKWLDQGVSIIGGCCGITPDHIKALDALRR